MSKKIFDIIPPTIKVNNIFKKDASKSPHPSCRSGDKFLRKAPSFMAGWRGLLLKITLVFCSIFGLIFFLNSQSKLILYVQPLKEEVKLEEDFRVDVSQESLNLEERIIPGQFFVKEEKKLETFQSTGNDFEEGSAKGIIRVYNTYSPPTPVSLKEGTRFLAAKGGKIFKAKEKIFLPSAKVQNGKIIPGFKDIEVIAQEAGEDYNIEPSKFSVPGLAGTALYYSLWAESEKNMEGGFKKPVKKITLDDLENAKNTLKIKLEEIAKNSLKNEISEDIILDEKLIFVEDFESSCQGQPETLTPGFNCEGSVKVKGMGFSFSDLKELIIYFILNKIPPSKNIKEDSLDLVFSPKNISSESGSIVFNIEAKVNVYELFNEDAFLSEIKGNSKEMIEKIVSESYHQIKNIEFKFWPFWVKKAPEQKERIKIELKF